MPTYPMMTAVVLPDRIAFDADFVPRFLDLSKTLVIPVGETFELPEFSTYDYIEVSGTLSVSRKRNTTVYVTHLFVLPGGHLDCGSDADPIPANVHVEFIIRDVPIDTRDPLQWGNGLLNFGTQDRCGAPKLAWTSLAAELATGAQTITLSADPTGWEIGDELLIPDTDQPTLLGPIRRESKVTVAGIQGRVVTLSKPLDFEHLAQREPDGTVVLQPRAANVTRNIVVRSQNPLGTPGHTANVGMGAMWCICYNENIGLGRTKAIKLDSTVLSTGHVGTNQVGRYSEHYHHAMGFGSKTIGNVARGIGITGTKWGFSVHDTSDAVVEDNVCFDFAGAGIVTEDGPEVRNEFRRNFCAYILGTNPGEVNVAQLVTDKNPGSEGAGFWFRGVQNIIEGNESWNCSFGIVPVQNGAVATVGYPSQPGGEADTLLNFHTAIPILFSDNVTASNNRVGLEYWAVPRFPAVNHTSSYNGAMSVQQAQSDPAAVWLVNPSLIGKDGTTIGLHASMAYTDTVEVSGGGRILGHANGLTGAGGVTFTKLVGSVSHPLRMQNVLDIDMRAVNNYSIEDNVLHVKYKDYPEQFIMFSPAEVWDGQPPLPRTGRSYWTTQRGSSHYLKNWQGTGKDYRLVMKQALGDFAALYSKFEGTDYNAFNVPEQGLTNAQAWTKYGMAYGGEEIDTTDVVPLVGLVNGFTRAEGPVKFGPPRAVLTLPNTWDSAHVEGDPSDLFVRGYGVMTGDATETADLFLFSLDGEPVVSVPQSEFGKPGARSFVLRNLTEGLHEVRTWRADVTGTAIPSTEMVFHYSVGPIINPPPPPPPPPAICTDPLASNFGGSLPCVYAPPPQTCQDPTALNFGGSLPCMYPPPPPPDPDPVPVPDPVWVTVGSIPVEIQRLEAPGAVPRFRLKFGTHIFEG